jgi:fumarate reductase subunit C
MPRLAHPHAMSSARPGTTRTAPPRLPPEFPLRGRYRAYTLFGATGLVYLLLGLLVLRQVFALGGGEPAWSEAMEDLRNPLYVVFHAFALACVVFVAVRFFALFPKAQPPRIGALRPPPQPVILALLYGAWIGVSLVLTAILVGGILR